MDVSYLGKLGELSLKKGNKKFFENRLAGNLRILLKDISAKIKVNAGRLILTADSSFSAQCEHALSHLIGITAWAKISVSDKNIDDIIAAAKEKAMEAKTAGCTTFKIEARRADKSFPLSSYQIAVEVGAVIHNSILTTDVHNPDVTINIEIRDKAIIYCLATDTHFRGLPCGVSGKGLLLLSGGIDSPVAGFKMLTRGMKIDCVYFHSYPYTSEEAQQKVETLAQKLADYGLSTFLNIISTTKIQERIRNTVDEAYLTLMLRMCMIKLATMVAEHIHADCLITGESLGQVASQTVENLSITNAATDMLVVRPLVGYDKLDITNIACRIGTYETSILPYDDCCVLFSPRHPSLHTDKRLASEIFDSMQIDSLLQEAYETRAVKKFTCR